MTDKLQEMGSNGSGPQKEFTLKKLYLKDLSFESPNSPAIFDTPDAEMANPQVQLNLKNEHKSLSDRLSEVILKVSVHATLQNQTLFMAEVEQAGVFTISGYTAEEKKKLIGTYCPSTLFPYAREAVSSAITKGGFPVLMLQPINFDALYAQASQKNMAAGTA